MYSYSYMISLFTFRKAKPDDGSLVEPKCVALQITEVNCCERKDCLIVRYCVSTTGMTYIRIINFGLSAGSVIISVDYGVICTTHNYVKQKMIFFSFSG